ncbi:MAG TPA: fructosamine kinase family protein [Longimicrobiales bacterium]|nr:fructosamine kinase family protein [Longimicrobiales bacterium]
MLDAALRSEVGARLGVQVSAAAQLGGGCISPAYRVECEDNTHIFLKTAPAGAPDGMLEQESISLERMTATGAVRVPHVLTATRSWLALEWLEPDRPRDGAWARLGRDLARMHRHSASTYGWESPNFIGSLPQANDASDEWPVFWREQRLMPQLRLARDRIGAAATERFDRLIDELHARLARAAEDGPSLLHGDLWNGNVHFTAERGALIDPSSYYGHREVDLAMAALFGGFPPAFFDAYSAEWPLSAGAAARRPIYQLYYLLVHVNLFGGGYVDQTRRALDAALAAPFA